jgi:hypothetical protein
MSSVPNLCLQLGEKRPCRGGQSPRSKIMKPRPCRTREEATG